MADSDYMLCVLQSPQAKAGEVEESRVVPILAACPSLMTTTVAFRGSSLVEDLAEVVEPCHDSRGEVGEEVVGES
jgi:hypothetical protein